MARLFVLLGFLGLLSCTAEPQTSAIQRSFKFVENFKVGDNIVVRALAMNPDRQRLWVGTSVGVLEVDAQTGEVANTFTRDHGLANEYVFAIFVDSKGQKWFGTNGGGATRYDQGKWKTFFPMHGLADYWVYSFAEDHQGNIWIGTWAGLNRWQPDAEKMQTYLKELVNEWVYGLAVDSRNRLWVGTEGGVNMFDGQQWAVWTHADGLGAANVRNLPFSSNTGLGTRDRHDLSVLQMGQETYNPNYVFCLAVDENDGVWAGTWGGGVSYFDGKQWRNFTEQDGLAGNIVYSIHIRGSDYWFGTNKGLSHYDGKQWQNYSTDDGLLDQHVYTLVSSDDDNLWLGSRHGVTHFKRN